MDYVSVEHAHWPDLRPAFPHARIMDPAIWSNPQRHDVYCDPEFCNRCGYATRDEALLIAAVALVIPPRNGRVKWLEIDPLLRERETSGVFRR